MFCSYMKINKLKLVDCTDEYWQFVRILRTDPRNISGFIKTNNITEDQQIEYMKKYSHNYKICLLDSTPVGFIGEIEGDIRVCTDHNYKNKGIAKFMVSEFLKFNPNIFAKIKSDNLSSLNLFESCGFKIKYFILEPNI